MHLIDTSAPVGMHILASAYLGACEHGLMKEGLEVNALDHPSISDLKDEAVAEVHSNKWA